MYKTKIILILCVLLLLQGCSGMFRKSPVLNSILQEAMQKPVEMASNSHSEKSIPLQVHYEFKHKPLRDQMLAISMEIKPWADMEACSYSVKLTEGLVIKTPTDVINIGSLKAGETYYEEVLMTPVNEGLYEVTIFIATEMNGQEPQVRSISIPVSVGPFQASRRQP